MKKSLILCTLLLSCVRLFALPSYEPFADATAAGGTSYTPTANLNGQIDAALETWWTVNSPGTPGAAVVITNSNLTPPSGLPGSSGTGVLLGANTTGYGGRFNVGVYPSTTNATLYYSCLINIQDMVGLLGTNGAFNMCFSSVTGNSTPQTGLPTSGLSGVLYMARLTNSTTQFVLGVGKGTGGTMTTRIFDTTAHNLNETIFVVVEYQIIGNTVGSSDDIARLWINPVSSSFATASSPAATVTAATTESDVASINSFVMLNRNTGTPKNMAADDLRIGTTWAYVTGGTEFILQPTNSQTSSVGTTMTMSAIAKSADINAPTYSWQRNGTTVSNGTQPSGAVVSGATTTNLVITSAGGPDSGTYTCVAANSAGSTSSSASLLSVQDPAITTQAPVVQSLAPGTTAHLNINALGTPPLTFQWNKQSGALINDGSHIFGATSTNLTIVNISASDIDTYTCVVTGFAGTRTSNPSALIIGDPAISVPPTNVASTYGATAVFYIGATGTGPFTYAWQYRGNNLSDGPSPSTSGSTISGSSSSSLTISGLSFYDADSYSVIVTNGLGATATSSSATLTVQNPVITTQPTNVSVTAGNPAVFTANAIGSALFGPIQYQWRKGTTALVNGSNITGQGTTSLTIINAQTANAGSYNVQVAGDDSNFYVSSNAVLTVIVPVSVNSAPLNRVQRVGENTAFAVGAAGTSVTYSWTKNGGSVLSTSSSIVLTNIQLSDSGTYQVVVNGQVGSATSTATLTVVTNLIHLATNRLVVSRVGDGAQSLARVITSSGNTLYLDQFDTNGNYFATTMIPDNTNLTTQALVVNGQDTTSGAVGMGESILGVSPNNRFLGFGGYNVNRPYTNNFVDAATSASAPRAGGVVNGLGYYALTWRSTSAFSGAAIRSLMPDSTATNFWSANGQGVHYVGGSANVTIDNSTDVANNRVIQGFTNSTTHSYDLYVSSAATTNSGLYKVAGTPTAAATFSLIFTNASTNLVNEFSISPDGLTAYIAEGLINANTGALIRYDNNGTSWTPTYTFAAPSRGLTVDWTGFTGGGASGVGAVLYATSAETNNNRLITVFDTGVSSAVTTLATAGTNTVFRSVRFGPVADTASIVAGPSNLSTNSGTAFALTVTAGGSLPFTYQWRLGSSPIAGATNSALTFASAQTTDSGTYSVVVANDLGTVTSTNATLVVINNTPPPLAIARAGNNAVLSWPASFTGFTLEGVANFTNLWTSAGSPTVVGTNNQVTNAISGNKFYRLKK